MRLDTASTVLNDALLELGLVAAELADPYASTDQNVVSLRAHLKALGRELLRKRAWSHLQKEHTFSTEAATASYALPADFSSMQPSTEWNRSTALPLGGPVGAQEWQLLKSSDTVSPINYFFRVLGNRLHLHPTPTAVETLAFEYVSAYWVQPSGESEPTTETPAASTDTLWFDGHLLSRGLKVRFLEAKGFDSSAARNEYEAALAEASGGDGAHAVLDLASGSSRYRPVPRLPETSWGV